MRDMSVARFGSGILGPCVVAASRVGNGVERAGYNFHYCIKARSRDLLECLNVSRWVVPGPHSQPTILRRNRSTAAVSSAAASQT
jgi:hypothetical protein